MIADTGLGFLSFDNSYIVFRDTNNCWKSRYFNYKIHNVENPLNSKIYVIFNRKLDLLSKEINLYLTEGIIDTIAISLIHFPDIIKRKDSIIAAANGKGFLKVIREIRKLGFLDIKLNIFSDSEIKMNFYRHIFSMDPIFKNFSNKIEIFYNDKAEDFGVPKEKVSIRKALL